MADEKDTDSTSESGAAARSGEPEDFEVGTDDVEDLNEPGPDETVDAADEGSDDTEPHEAGVDDAESDESEFDESELDESDSDAEDDADDADRELVGAGVGSRTASAGGSSGDDSDGGKRRGRRPKGRPTPSRKGHAEEPAKGTPLTFIRGSIGELKQVVYPTGPQLMNYFVVVLVFVLFIIAIVTAMDAGFGWVMLKVFG